MLKEPGRHAFSFAFQVMLATSMALQAATGLLVIILMALLMGKRNCKSLRTAMHIVIAMFLFIITTLNLIIFVISTEIGK
jgi:hypothetical protein